ncbi:MAG TPA: 50S ribosomal protein L17 [Bacteroidia bacterium]
MRHGNKNNHLGRKKAHVDALMSNMAASLLLSKNKRIETTVAKAKALKRYVEPLITRSKNDTTHSRRVVFSYLQNKEAVTTLFRDVAGKVADRKGGYTRILKTGNRLGDNAEMCLLELVDFNETMLASKGTTTAKAKTTRRGRSKKKTSGAEGEAKTEETKTEEGPSEETKTE